MLFQAPIDWVIKQGGGTARQLAYHLDLYRRFDAGEDGSASTYVDYLRRYTPEDKIPEVLERRRRLHHGPQPTEPAKVILNSKGQFELLDGHHRSARFVHDGSKTIPVDVKVISPSWTHLEATLDGLYPHLPKHLYQDIEHPWFNTWTVGRSPERIPMVLEAASAAIAKGNVLEIGSCTGRLAREFSRAGWRCFGIDIHAPVVRVAEYLDTVFGTRVNYWNTSDHSHLLDHGPTWNVLVCLSVFHRPWVKGRRDYVAGLFTRYMARSKVFITDCEKVGTDVDGAITPHPDVYQDWLTKLATLNGRRLEVIGETDGRRMFLIKEAK